VPELERPARLAAPGAAARRVTDLWSAAAHLERTAGVPPGRLGVLGVGLGGLDAWAMAQASGEAAPRAVVLYGTQPGALTEAARVGAAVQAHYGAGDRRAVADLPALEQRLRAAGCVYALRVHAGAGRVFWNEPAAQAAAWAQMLRWFTTHLVPRARPAARAAARPAPGVGPGPRARPN
jgi:dienelactone hydrolase